MKVSPERIVHTALELLDEIGLEKLTLRSLATRLQIQAPTLYWHFKSKQALIDEMATTVLSAAAVDLLAEHDGDNWSSWLLGLGHGMRRHLLGYRDGGRMIAGSRLTNTVFQQTTEQIGRQLLRCGLSERQAVVLLSAIYTFTVSFVIEEQAVFPRRGERSAEYDLQARNQALDPHEFPFMRMAGPILFDDFEQRYQESLQLLLAGAEVQAQRDLAQCNSGD